MKKKNIIFLFLITILSILSFYPKNYKINNTYICTIYNKENIPITKSEVILQGVVNKNILLRDYFQGTLIIDNTTYLIKSPHSNRYNLLTNTNQQNNYFKLSSLNTNSQTGETSYIAIIIVNKNFNTIIKGQTENIEKKYGKGSYFKSNPIFTSLSISNK
ncbi:hypothetical protein [Paramaledivibacter caminithermalis]|uniref:Uncharacterized protein n=1 Tax=Paramaledivibacter caminithermalis (strain DSM 15212 / CIP 107654 / DViRD3) TaxID=1121301 RepID=A0A1M6PRL2_PARC5|nr:hypothetical protein [Paramaledivibacter caminithermalis]SHK10583.1 hypothetical protein SAMN02745912_02262 [Paramaledivibacter caminithermalis DSM 15212]